MQSSKLPRKTSKSIEKPVDAVVPESAQKTAAASRPAKVTPETTASVQASETTVPKRHRSTSKSISKSEPASTEVTKSAPIESQLTSAQATSAPSASIGKTSKIEKSAPLASPGAESASPKPEQQPVTEEMIAKLAYTYWMERGQAHGSPEQDWLRAEQRLKATAASA